MFLASVFGVLVKELSKRGERGQRKAAKSSDKAFQAIFFPNVFWEAHAVLWGLIFESMNSSTWLAYVLGSN